MIAPPLRMGRWLVAGLLGLCLLIAPAARAATATTTSGSETPRAGSQSPRTVTKTVTTQVAPGTPQLVTSQTKPPAGYRLNADQVLAIAAKDPRVRAELRRHPHAVPYEYTKGAPQWQVSWFTRSKPQKELLQVYVDDDSERVTQAWTGFQVAWTMARGYPGAFGRVVNAWYLWAPLCVLFLAPFVPWRRRPTLLHLDLLMLLGFSISLAFFNHGTIGLSVPLVYPFLLYLLARLLALAGGRGVPSQPLRTIVPLSWLAIGAIFLMAFRIALNVLDSNVIDVGYAGVIGADKLVHGHALYGHWPADNAFGDTYGPIVYYAYVPFRLIFGWSGRWDSLPAAHAAAIAFDVLSLLGVFLLGRRIRGNALGVVLAYGWAAYPFTLYSLSSNSNDSLVAALACFAVLGATSAPARGVLSGLAGLTKFAPFALVPLLLRGTSERLRPRELAVGAGALAATVVICMLPVLLHRDLRAFWHDSIAYQAGRQTPFSIWGLWGGLGIVQHLVQAAVVLLALAVAVVPRRRGTLELAALGAAVIIALQLAVTYWLYPYVVWFFPLAFAALLGSHPDPGERLEAAWRDLEERRAAEPAAAMAPLHWYRPPYADG